jgi:hypothetical protein
MKKLLIAALSAGLLVPTVVTAKDVMAPGKPAGIRAAQSGDNTLLFIGLGVAAAVVIGVVASSGNDAPVVPTPSTAT